METTASTAPSAVGNHISARRGRGTRRPLSCTLARRPRATPWPSPSPCHTASIASNRKSAPNTPGAPPVDMTDNSTAPRDCNRATSRRAVTAFTACAPGPSSSTSNPSIIAASTSAHCPSSKRCAGSATITNRSGATPSSTAAATPTCGRPATPTHAPASDGPAASASASDTAAEPAHSTTLPRCITAWRSNSSNAGSIAMVRCCAAAPDNNPLPASSARLVAPRGIPTHYRTYVRFARPDSHSDF